MQICRYSPSYGAYSAFPPSLQYQPKVSGTEYDRGSTPIGGTLASLDGAIIEGWRSTRGSDSRELVERSPREVYQSGSEVSSTENSSGHG